MILKPNLALLEYGQRGEAELYAMCRTQDLTRRFKSTTHPERRQSYFGARAALATLVGPLGLEEPVLNNEVFGFPTLGSGPTLPAYISLAHTQGAAMAAMAPTPIGVDIELKNRDASKTVRRIFNSEEAESFARLGLAPVYAWVAKEAVSKALGLGMKFGMAAFCVDWNSEGVFTVRVDVPHHQAPFSFSSLGVRLVERGAYLIGVAGEMEQLASEPTIFDV